MRGATPPFPYTSSRSNVASFGLVYGWAYASSYAANQPTNQIHVAIISLLRSLPSLILAKNSTLAPKVNIFMSQKVQTRDPSVHFMPKMPNLRAARLSRGPQPHLLHTTQSDQKVSVNLTIIVQSSGAQRLFDRPV